MTTCDATRLGLEESYNLNNASNDNKILPTEDPIHLKFTKDNVCYMCPKCLHLFFQKNDMTRHIHRKISCKQAYICTLSGSEILRKSYNRYYFHGVTKFPLLSTSQKINMVTHYDHELNMIYDTSLLISLNKSLPLERHIMGNSTGLADLQSAEDISGLRPLSSASHHQPEEESKNSSTIDSIAEPTELFNENIIVINGVAKYQCKMCKYNFTCKRNLIRHLDRKNSCNYQSQIRKISSELSVVKTSGTISETINAVKSITITDGTSKVFLRDFVYDHYDYSHIDKKLALKDVFFDHYVFLSTLFSNNVNKNLFFDDRYGYFYVEGKVERAPKEKVGYVLMEKLSITVTSFIRTNPEIDQDSYAHIIKFYSVETFKYCFDTYYRSYDMVKREYIFNNVMMLRTRDHYLGDFVRAINYYKDWTLLLMGVKSLDNLHITSNYELDIPEKYQAVQHRYSNPKYAYYY